MTSPSADSDLLMDSASFTLSGGSCLFSRSDPARFTKDSLLVVRFDSKFRTSTRIVKMECERYLAFMRVAPTCLFSLLLLNCPSISSGPVALIIVAPLTSTVFLASNLISSLLGASFLLFLSSPFLYKSTKLSLCSSRGTTGSWPRRSSCRRGGRTAPNRAWRQARVLFVAGHRRSCPSPFGRTQNADVVPIDDRLDEALAFCKHGMFEWTINTALNSTALPSAVGVYFDAGSI